MIKSKRIERGEENALQLEDTYNFKTASFYQIKSSKIERRDE